MSNIHTEPGTGPVWVRNAARYEVSLRPSADGEDHFGQLLGDIPQAPLQVQVV